MGLRWSSGCPAGRRWRSMTPSSGGRRGATAGRPGPVALIIPHDVFDARLPEEGGGRPADIAASPALTAPCDPAWGRYPALRAAPEPAAVAEAARRLREARCPVMVAG